MRYLALATDYDHTLAPGGRVAPSTIKALERLKASGRKLILVTGRQLESLLHVFPEYKVFDWLVVENGGLLYDPETGEETPLGDPPPQEMIDELQQRGVEYFDVGRTIINSWEPYQETILGIIKDLGLESQVIFNKGAVMVLPSGVNKATGLLSALQKLGLSPHNVVAIGDAENDHAFLQLCEVSVAVANALPMLKKQADWVTESGSGKGVVQVIEALLADDLAEIAGRLKRHWLTLGTGQDGQALRVQPYGKNVLVVGIPASGKTTFALNFMEQLQKHEYQFTILDPEGDYQSLEDVVILGSQEEPPVVEEVLELLRKTFDNCVVSSFGIQDSRRGDFFDELWDPLLELRQEYGRPHWLLLDEAHQLMPSSKDASVYEASKQTGQPLQSIFLISAFPDIIAPLVLESVDLVVAVGEDVEDSLKLYCQAMDRPCPALPAFSSEQGEGLAWWTKTGESPVVFHLGNPKTKHKRHSRKYVEGDISPEDSFYFVNPNDRNPIRAQNLMSFIDLSDQVSDETWMYHLKRGDYSRWVQEVIGDSELAKEIGEVEQVQGISPKASREKIRSAIEARYTRGR